MVYNYDEYLKIPKYPRYGFVYYVLGDFIDDTINYPVDLRDICDKNNWKLIPYTSFDWKLYSISSDGFSFVNNGEVYIFYNESRMTERINFTIAHEIGHIVLGHLFTNDVLSHNKLVKNNVLEIEANVFARNLLSPAPLIVNLKQLPSSKKFAKKFNVSEQFMNIRYQYLDLDYRSVKYSDRVVEKFKHYTNEINLISVHM